MKTATTTIVLTALLLVSLLAAPLPAQTPGEIAAKCVKALGGEAGIKNYSNYKAKGGLEISFGPRMFTGEATVIQKGEKYRLDFHMKIRSNVYSISTVFDGQAAWMDRRGYIADQPALNFQSDADHTPALLLEKNAHFAMTGNTEIEGKKALGIEVTFKDKKTVFYIDQTDYTLLEIAFEDIYFGDNQTKETFEKRIRYLDYKEKQGIMFPHAMAFYEKGRLKMKLLFKELTFNPTAPPALFERPDREIDLRYGEERYH
jgi:outer membrane lipoprotein-sorting protein